MNEYQVTAIRWFQRIDHDGHRDTPTPFTGFHYRSTGSEPCLGVRPEGGKARFCDPHPITYGEALEIINKWNTDGVTYTPRSFGVYILVEEPR